MAKHYRHHRKIKHNAPIATQEHVNANSSGELTPTPFSVTTLGLREDLRKTAIVTGALAVALTVLTILNIKYGWTVELGSWLYRLLNIR